MNGLELSKDFYAHCRPILAESLGQLMEEAAFGLVGEGSECFGCDDVISRDHDFGPGFCIWVDDDLLRANRETFQAALSKLPATFADMPARLNMPGRVGLIGIKSFYRFFTGLETSPQDWRQWLQIPEYQLAAATNGEVFEDCKGSFSQWRKALLDYYPRDVWLKKLAGRAMIMAQTGQYNLRRCLERGEFGAAFLAAARFSEAALAFVFLINRRYMPFYKWAPRLASQLPVLGASVRDLIDFIAGGSVHNSQEMLEQIEQFCSLCASHLRAAGLSSEPSSWLWAHGPQIASHIATPELLKLNILED